MFTTGQFIFAALFIVAFIAVMIFVYKKDKKTHEKNYKGVGWVLFFFVIFIFFLFVIKFFLKN